MTYEEIKARLYKAGRLVDDGRVEEAGRLIRSMIGKGLAQVDLEAHLTTAQLRKLREDGSR